MLTQEENELLTRVGPGTPAGELLRRYWQPAALTEELPMGGPPLPVRLLGEDLVLFRDEQGRTGLLGLHCSHRGADLSYGRLEDGGLRCIYHGWLYDIHGRCLEQPGEPAGSQFHEKIRHVAYPCVEAGGMILGYLGPGEPPLVPAYRFLTAPDECRFNSKWLHDCNYLQSNEGNIDSVHLNFLHWGDPINRSNNRGYDLSDPVETDYGLKIYWIQHRGPEQDYVHVINFAMPNLGINGTWTVQWHVPIDDTHHWQYYVQASPTPVDHEAIRRSRAEITPDYRQVRNRSNRYLQDREEMKTRTFSGLGAINQPQDACVTETAGAIYDRTQEHLAHSDTAVVAARRLLFQAIKDVQEGRDPLHVVRDPERNDFSHIWGGSALFPASVDWRTCREEELTGFPRRNRAIAEDARSWSTSRVS